MKHIATQKHTSEMWGRITGITFIFTTVVSAFGMFFVKHLDDGLLKLMPDQDMTVAKFLAAVALSIIWGVLIASFGYVYGKVLGLAMMSGWPRYFFYVFQFSEGKTIVGWTRIRQNRATRALEAEGQSFTSDGEFNDNNCVSWKSETVSGGTYLGNPSCYIVYTLNDFEAQQLLRPYRVGLLRFRQLHGDNMKVRTALPTPSTLGADQYFGHQQAIDKDGVWNLAYAESAHIQSTGIYEEMCTRLTHELSVRHAALEEALRHLKKDLKP